MKKRLLSGMLAMLPLFCFSQVSVTSANGMRTDTLLNRYFAGGGVVISNARFNGQQTINSNQIGTFVNPTTHGLNMPIGAGIVMVTGDYNDAASGRYTGEVTSSAEPPSDGDTISPALAEALKEFSMDAAPGVRREMYDVAVLTFDFIPMGDEIAFKYSFASEEYPHYVCNVYNDIFGFFLSGPYDEAGNPITNEGIIYKDENIALIPGTDLPVSINTVNHGIAIGNVTPCVLENSQYFRLNDNNNCKMNGYTTELETKKVSVVPCRTYKLELAICDVVDNRLSSAVYLSANSFRTDELSLSKPRVAPNEEHPYRFIKGCSYYDISMYLNRPAIADETHALVFHGGTAEEGADYTLSDLNGNPVGNMLTFNEGDTSATLRINFVKNENDVPGEIKTLIIMTEDITDCAIRDTLVLEVATPYPLTHTLYRQSPNGWTEFADTIVYCEEILPVNEKIKIEVAGQQGEVTYRWSLGSNIDETENTINTTEAQVVYVNASDACGRETRDTIHFVISSLSTTASADKEDICIGNEVILTTDEAVGYVWTSKPYDESLACNSDVRQPHVSPTGTTTYTVEATNRYGCKAVANVRIKVIPPVVATMKLTPEKTTTANPDVKFLDLTTDSYSRIWDFGDGQSSTASSGIVSYSGDDTATYSVMLIAFNSAHCPDTTYGTVHIAPEFTIWLPNSFTPASGDANALFGPVFSFDTEYELSIFSRNGDKIFQSTPKQRQWDGRINDTDYAPDGVYVYMLMYRDGNGLLKRKTGTVNLILNTK